MNHKLLSIITIASLMLGNASQISAGDIDQYGMIGLEQKYKTVEKRSIDEIATSIGATPTQNIPSNRFIESKRNLTIAPYNRFGQWIAEYSISYNYLIRENLQVIELLDEYLSPNENETDESYLSRLTEQRNALAQSCAYRYNAETNPKDNGRHQDFVIVPNKHNVDRSTILEITLDTENNVWLISYLLPINKNIMKLNHWVKIEAVKKETEESDQSFYERLEKQKISLRDHYSNVLSEGL